MDRIYEVTNFPSSTTMWTYTALVLRIYTFINYNNFNAISEIIFCHILENFYIIF